MRNENFIYLRKGVRRIEIVTMCFSQEPEKKNLVTLSFFFQDYFISSYLPPQMTRQHRRRSVRPPHLDNCRFDSAHI